jgi:hypothetical protein
VTYCYGEGFLLMRWQHRVRRGERKGCYRVTRLILDEEKNDSCSRHNSVRLLALGPASIILTSFARTIAIPLSRHRKPTWNYCSGRASTIVGLRQNSFLIQSIARRRGPDKFQLAFNLFWPLPETPRMKRNVVFFSKA